MAVDIAAFASLEAFTEAYVRVMHLPYYDALRDAARRGAGVRQLARLLGESPYEEHRYTGGRSGAPGSLLLDIMDDFDLTRCDDA